MLIPVRCYTCGKVLGDKWEHYKDIIEKGESQPKAFEIIGLKRYCCKRVLLGHVDLIDILIKYDDNSGSIKVDQYETINISKSEDDSDNLFK
jgi:DNA-directed RNA polymerase subunit N (RpoN/RPB10)